MTNTLLRPLVRQAANALRRGRTTSAAHWRQEALSLGLCSGKAFDRLVQQALRG